MKRVTRSAIPGIFALAVLTCTSASARQVATAEIEPNDSKFQATGAVATCGVFLTGATRGTSTTVPGLESAYYFRIALPSADPGIYEYEITLSSATSGHTPILRGRRPMSGIPDAASDLGLQSGVLVGVVRLNRLYGFGNGGEVYYRVHGSAATTEPYTASLECRAVVPIRIDVPLQSGPITIRPGAENTANIDYWVYSSTFTAIPGFGHDDPDLPGISRLLMPGVYYLALGDFNTANNLVSPADDSSRSGNVTDFPGVVVSNSASPITNMSVEVLDGIGTVARGFGSKTDPFQVVWYRFVVGTTSEVEPNDTKGTATPALPACGDMVSGATAGGGVSHDLFLITPPAGGPGIRLHKLILTTVSSGITASLRGISQENGTPVGGAGSDTELQSSVLVGNDRINAFYTTGAGGQVFYRVQGLGSESEPYTARMTCTAITPTRVSIDLQAGPITIRPAPGNTSNVDYWVYESSLNPLVDFGHDEPDTPGISRALGIGVYYVAFGDFNTANDLGSPADDALRSGVITDYPRVVANSSPATIANLGIEIVDHAGTVATGVGSKAGPFEVVWYTFTVSPGGACCCGTTCTLRARAECSGPNALFVGTGIACNRDGSVSTPCCLADFNRTGGISVQDFFDFFAAYFGGDPCSDFNGGGLGSGDVFGFISAYFVGCF